MHWRGGGGGAQCERPMPICCLPDGKCQLQWYLQPPPTALATSSNRLPNRLWGRLLDPSPSNASLPPEHQAQTTTGASTSTGIRGKQPHVNGAPG